MAEKKFEVSTKPYIKQEIPTKEETKVNYQEHNSAIL